ncbi:uncharacterized protein AB675_4505 [Cyphellophora attinorum]|uniref:Ribosome biogenesis protein NOP53 n=1 Tax=Cyphellophora attinorum TaxID=1664694 RepID=A0A0N1P0G7_9EURO|nr:uncharacterized protein AB675_4505 [Phialophora attinorum]KPI38986.1 hypothetical protein AB675_4505 [Phialophora attinorum]
MPTATGQPAQPKQTSRKGKKAWRKHVDTTEIEEGLENLREDIRQGGPVSEKPSDELFVFDTAGSDDIRKKHKLSKTLKVDEILAQRSAVAPVDGRKRSSRVTDGLVEPSSKRQKKDWVSRKDLQRLKQGLDAQSLIPEHLGEADSTGFDLWSETPSAVATVYKDEYIPDIRPKVAPATIQQPAVPLTASGKPVRPVAQPEAEASYNPLFDAWADRYKTEGEREVEVERQRLERARQEEERQARIEASAAEADRENETDYESAWEGFETEDETTLKRKRPERKTPQQRNKIKRRKAIEQQAKHEAASSKKQKQAEAAVMAMIEAQDDREVAAVESDESENGRYDNGSKLRRRKRGTMNIPEQNLEFVLPDELQESLRRLKPEGNLTRDRFRNLLINGKLDSRALAKQQKKKQIKYTEKWSYKNFDKNFEIPV